MYKESKVRRGGMLKVGEGRVCWPGFVYDIRIEGESIFGDVSKH